MLEREFFKKYAIEIVTEYREHIFDPAGGGSGAKDVHGKSFSSNYTAEYLKAKRGRKLPRRRARFSNSNAPVLTGDLMFDFETFELISGGFRFGTKTRGSVVKNLNELGREISTESKPIPIKVEDFILKSADEYGLKVLRKQQKGGTFNIG